MQQIWERIATLQAAGQPAVLATIIATRGSTPRNVGTGTMDVFVEPIAALGLSSDLG